MTYFTNHVSGTLAEARDALSRLLEEAQENPDWDLGDLSAEMPHLYHHINTAWNGRDSTNAVDEVSEVEFRQWSAFPADLPMFE